MCDGIAVRPLARVFPLILLLAVVGCGGGGIKPPGFADRLAPVEGTVKLDGEPLAGANIDFHPDPKEPGGEMASAQTDAAGKYTLITPLGSHEPGKGAVPGKYQVVISKIAMPDGSPLPPGTTDADAEAEGAKQVVPPRYSDFERTTLTVDVTEGENVHDFELTSR